MSKLRWILINNRKTVDLDLILAAHEKFENPCYISFCLGRSYYSRQPSPDSTISAAYQFGDDRQADEIGRWLSVKDKEVNFNIQDALRYLRARLNGRPASFLELVLLTDELELQRQMNQFAFNVIEDHTRATPIYM